MTSIRVFRSAISDEEDNVTSENLGQHESYSETCSTISDELVQKYSEIDLSEMGLEDIPAYYIVERSVCEFSPVFLKCLSLKTNRIAVLNPLIASFSELTYLDLSNNLLTDLPQELTSLRNLQILAVKNNQLDSNSLPKNFGSCLTKLEILNFSGNHLEEFPTTILDLPALKYLHLGGNRLRSLPCCIGDMLSLESFYLGGNRLTDIPATIGKLKNLISLNLCDNQLETIPSTVALLRNLEHLSLHNNCLKMLPVELMKLKHLQQLSLRSNPLVVRFVQEMTFDPPSLKELAGRATKLNKMDYSELGVVPATLVKYLDSAHHCVNPKCKGVYFEARIEHVKFVDFCGKYRVPLLQYLCSPKCSASSVLAGCNDNYSGASSSEADHSDQDDEQSILPKKIKKVLLG